MARTARKPAATKPEIEEIKPGRDPVIRTAPSPADMNGNGDIFGGWVMAQMDIAGGITAARAAQGRVATVAVAGMTFNKPIKVGDVVSIYCDIERLGNTSVTVKLETIVQRRLDPEPIKVTEGTFVFVAIDKEGRPRPIPKPGGKHAATFGRAR
ncbi:MAG: acyl-CoA thioesterase [Reyranellaceae bacterium]